MDLTAKAYEEAQRLLEKCFSYHNPSMCEIYVEDVPFEEREKFCSLVEDELLVKGEKITRFGSYFKIPRYQS